MIVTTASPSSAGHHNESESISRTGFCGHEAIAMHAAHKPRQLAVVRYPVRSTAARHRKTTRQRNDRE
jgi:hypothetical protein